MTDLFAHTPITTAPVITKTLERVAGESEHSMFTMQYMSNAICHSTFKQSSSKKISPVDQVNHQATSSVTKAGNVYLVGAGSGDPELLTLKAYRIMQCADVVLYDSLVSEDILDMCAVTAEKIFVGKRRANHALPQQGINELLVKHALAGKTVVRLKGGDPFIFGRGGEELQEVVKYGIHFESIPGITAASAAASSTGIPLTHRDHAQSVKFVTACKKAGAPNNDYSELLDPTQTVVLYMGLHRLEEMTQGLITAGRDADTPFAIISHASLPTHQILTGTLGNIAAKQAAAQLPTPALLIMGDVVTLHDELAPYNLANQPVSLPKFNKASQAGINSLPLSHLKEQYCFSSQYRQNYQPA